ncbi:MAG: putative repeat protein (TIGR01451 family) [Mariniblastus sp.]|jgi:uncharacterized repeat protein (TIGR01451 family)
MLALKSKLNVTWMLVGTIILLGGSTFGQQTPSQLYRPTQTSTQAPPSVHIPQQATQKLPKFRQSSQSKFQNSQLPSATNQGRTQFNFSDQTIRRANDLQSAANSRSRQNQNRSQQYQTGSVQQTSYQAEGNGTPIVPQILKTTPQTAPLNPPGAKMTNPSSIANSAGETRKTPADFAAAMSQVRTGFSPRVAPKELANQTNDINAQMARVRQASKAKAEEAEAKAAEQQKVDQLDLEKLQVRKFAAEKIGAAEFEAQLQTQMLRTQVAREAAQRVETENTTADRIAGVPTTEQQIAQPKFAPLKKPSMPEISASEFISQISPTHQPQRTTTTQPFVNPRPSMQQNTMPPAMTATAPRATMSPTQDNATAPKLVVKQARQTTSQPAVIQLANTDYNAPSTPKQEMVKLSSHENDVQAKPSIQLGSPSINVETFGPRTVGVNKPANYQVVVNNTSNTIAERILVGINMPQWIDIENVNLTSGGKELTDGKDQARLVWSIDRIPANSSQTITITAVPRKAEVFDVGVEWTLVPRVGKTNVNVTEPKLEMSIAGPKEVAYGETALYHVTVRNPGTGAAENVIVMLSEALGGERSAIGNIEAGKETHFQVELLARTAGALKLVATAAADGNLKTSAERDLMVRRANLSISLDGPGLKYAGSVAQYSVSITNTGDAVANEIISAIALPTGVKYISGIETVKLIEGGMRWPVGSLEPNQTKTYKINCQLDTSGDLQLEVGARGRDDLAASSACLTTVETIADLVLQVADPKGPLPTGEAINYEITVRNRGSRSAEGVNLVMQFSEGIEPKLASKLKHSITPGEVKFAPIAKIEPGQTVSFKVSAEALQAGTHLFRAQLTCEDSGAHEVAEGTTRFFGESVRPVATADAASANDFAPSQSGEGKFK